MLKIKRKSFFILSILVIISFIFILNELLNIEKEKKSYNITIITDDEINEGSITMKSGADKAAEEMNVDIRFVSLSKDDFLEEQKELLMGENNGETDAILIEPIRYEYLKDTIEKVNKFVPVISLQSYSEKNYKINSVVFDNFNMGVDIGDEILKSVSGEKNLVIVKDDLKSDVSEERYKGLISALQGNIQYKTVEFKNSKHMTYYETAKHLIESDNVDIIVTFNTKILESVSQAKSDLLGVKSDVSNIKVYGTGNTRKVISFLDQNIINGIALENEFNIGYLGVKNALNLIKDNEFKSDIISSKIITRDNMYSVENQRLLFLFIR
ncbi:substrate-binding domain-containing protein [Clostridium butyricum]|uniref:Periplasmic binding protein domain-containing protein n=1 Tax=Clostridium butyricum TaxID=1492 RepID=A0A0A6Q0F2_CLOBU|nr:substrate-binding domain-containing protein [Clostridium butyricum]KHD13476.1 hypothetical protein OA81_20570 [Clostridium butyricum]KHD16468.1 hypothetical protein OA81_04880 [Clostridium butyricum]PPV14890.1 hypothetical protein AWN73_13525 [Clostridium butyricum]